MILTNMNYLLFLGDIHEGYLSFKSADLKQGGFAIEWKIFKKGAKRLEKKYF